MAHGYRPEAAGSHYTVWPYWIARPRTLSLAAGLVMAGLTVLYFVWVGYMVSIHRSIRESTPILLALVCCHFCLYFNRLYDLGLGTNWRSFIARALQSLAAVIALLMVMFVLFPHFPREDYATLFVVLGTTLLIVLLRPVVHWLVDNGRIGERILIVGNGQIGQKLFEELTQPKPGKQMGANRPTVIMSATESESRNANSIAGDQIKEMIRRSGVSRVVLAEPDPRRREELGTALLGCKLRGVPIQEAVDFCEQFNRKIWLEGMHSEWLIYSDGFRPSRFFAGIKRTVDILCSLGVIVITAPVMALVAIAIRLDSPGPILFRQERVGLDGKEFVLMKFRSMRQDAERTTGPTWASENDDRVTRVGKILRKFRLDELPQVFNVLSGEMSFVGPRPERPYFVDLLREKIPYYDLRHYVKPGITGWAQVMYPYGASIEDAYEKLQYDFYYAKHISVGMDLYILFKTVKVVLFGRGL